MQFHSVAESFSAHMELLRTYAEEFVHAMNELAGNFTDDEDRSRNCETTGPKPGPTEVVKWFLLLPTDTDHHLPDFPFALTIRRAHETPGSARNVHRSAPNLQEDDAELSDLFYSMQAIETLPGNRSFAEGAATNSRYFKKKVRKLISPPVSPTLLLSAFQEMSTDGLNNSLDEVAEDEDIVSDKA
eukprot:g22895.t1